MVHSIYKNHIYLDSLFKYLFKSMIIFYKIGSLINTQVLVGDKSIRTDNVIAKMETISYEWSLSKFTFKASRI